MAREIVKSVTVKGPKGREGKCILYSDNTIRIDWVRFSYPHLKTPYKGKDDKGEAKFGVVGLLGKKTHNKAIDLIDDEIDRILKENKVKALGADKKFMRDGDESDKADYEGFMTVSARESRRPPLRNRANEPVEPSEADEVFQPGFWGSILIRPWWQNNDFGKRVNAGLSSAQMTMEDEVFGEGRLSEEDLDDTFDKHDDDDDDSSSSRRRRSRDDDEPEPRSRRRRAEPADDEDDDI